MGSDHTDLGTVGDELLCHVRILSTMLKVLLSEWSLWLQYGNRMKRKG